MMLHTKYLSSRPYGFEEEAFISFTIYFYVKTKTPWGGANFDPKVII